MAKHKMPSRKRKRIIAACAAGVMAVGAAIGVATASAHGGPGQAEGPAKEFYIDIQRVRPNVNEPELKSKGTFVSECGRNENGHRNPDNFIVAPGVRNGAQHMHDYVGNLSTNGDSDNESLAAAGTTCQNGDLSTYFWPVLRRLGVEGPDQDQDGGGKDGNEGEILVPAAVKLEFRGNAKSNVSAMPRFLRVITGDAKAATNGDANANAKWTCTGFEDRQTTKYPLCPQGSQVVRVLDFPSCWDGRNTDSENHRDHIRFPDESGACPRGTRAVPQLRMTLTYDTPNQPQSFAIDSFPDQGHNPVTDHADFANVMPRRLMDTVARCINDGQSC